MNKNRWMKLAGIILESSYHLAKSDNIKQVVGKHVSEMLRDLDVDSEDYEVVYDELQNTIVRFLSTVLTESSTIDEQNIEVFKSADGDHHPNEILRDSHELGVTNALMAFDQKDDYESLEDAFDSYYSNVIDSAPGLGLDTEYALMAFQQKRDQILSKMDLKEQRQRHGGGMPGGMGADLTQRAVDKTVEAFVGSIGSRRAAEHSEKIEELRSKAYELAHQIFDDLDEV